LQDHGFSVLGPASSVDTAIAIADKERPDLALVDIDLRGSPPGTVLVKVLAERLQTPSVFLTGQEAAAYAHRDHALGLILKPVMPETLIEAVRFFTNIADDDPPSGVIVFSRTHSDWSGPGSDY